MNEPASEIWLRCSACRKEIAFGKIHWVCSVSTCNRARMALVFCSVSCWDSHVATLRHRDAWAVEARAPSRAEGAAGRSAPTVHADPASAPVATAAPMATVAPVAPREALAARHEAPARHAVVVAPRAAPTETMSTRSATTAGTATIVTTAATGGPALSSSYERDVMIVVSKLKKYIKDRSGMNTSDSVAEALGDHVRVICDEAIRAAHADGRKTVLDRDLPRPGC